MQKVMRKFWLPMAAFIAIVSLGLVFKTTTSSESYKSTNGIVVDNQVTNHLWCTSTTLENACGACKKAKRPPKAVKPTLLSSCVQLSALELEIHKIPGNPRSFRLEPHRIPH